MWVIGEDIAPGTYRSVEDMPGDGQGCSILADWDSGAPAVSLRIEDGPIVVRIPKSHKGLIYEVDEDCPTMVRS